MAADETGIAFSRSGVGQKRAEWIPGTRKAESSKSFTFTVANSPTPCAVRVRVLLDTWGADSYFATMIATHPARRAPGKKAWTEAELQALPEDGYVHEVVDGELVMSPKNDFFHGQICTRLSSALVAFNREHRLGVVLDSSTGFWMNNRNCRAPDISFVPKERLRRMGFKPSAREFLPGAPDLAVEILSPNNTRREIDDRLRDFFDSGTQMVWVIDPERRRVEVCHSPARRELLGSGGFLEGGGLLPGFRYPIADLFKEWDWE